MPVGKYSFYLHSDDRTDTIAIGTIASVSQPLRGDFICSAAIAGSVLYRIDTRLPALLTELFDGALKAGQMMSVIAALSGRYSDVNSLQDEAGGLSPCRVQGSDTGYERRRFTLHLADEVNAQQTMTLLDESPSRLRGKLIRNLVIAGLALYTLDPRLPRLLACMPVPPDSLEALKVLVSQVTNVTQPRVHSERDEVGVTEDVVSNPESPSKSLISQNMGKLF
ncbi:hypothetical protein BIY27_12130 [Gibbsiella quercinecans]|uniref:plasmid partitioning/stability family protein n=1 Tax=Gibbsiella quercinecans TaxID=929813 RepID=UPI000EF1FB9D|nr:plasmid partitioning/stability family protein [Gibbsiella quercinecans]RLM11781.1 hypothetical protein BIY27_12130 [Gibbsiella quercinecans]